MVSILLYILKLKEYQSVGYYTQKTKIIFCCIKQIGDHTCMCQDPCIFIFTEYWYRITIAVVMFNRRIKLII